MSVSFSTSFISLLLAGTCAYSSVFPDMQAVMVNRRTHNSTFVLKKTHQLPPGVESNANILYFLVNLPRDIQDLKMPSGTQQVVTLFEELSDESEWHPTSKEIMPFNADGYPAGKQNYRMDDDWWLTQEMTGTLQSGGRLTELICTEYEQDGSSGGMSISYTWAGERITTAQIVFDGGATGEMVANYSYEYTADGHLERLRGIVNILEEEMDMFDAVFSYSNGRLVEISVVQHLVESRTREQYAYDDANNKLTVTAQTLNVDTWVNDARTIYAFDQNGRVLSETEQYSSENEWVNDWKLERYWGTSSTFFDSTSGYRASGPDDWELAERISNTITATSANRPAKTGYVSGHSGMTIRTSATGTAYINLHISNAVHGGVAIYDCRGRLCATPLPFGPMKAGEYRLTWSASGGTVPLSPGGYLCVLRTETDIINRAVSIKP